MKKEYLEDMLNPEEQNNWDMKMDEPLKVRKLSDQELSDLKQKSNLHSKGGTIYV